MPMLTLKPYGDMDPIIASTLNWSSIYGRPLRAWLEDYPPARVACVLNILAALRSRPTPTNNLLLGLGGIVWAGEDRCYFRARDTFGKLLTSLSRAPARPVYKGGPILKAHKQIFTRLEIPPRKQTNYRTEGHPSIQLVVTEPDESGGVYVDVDLDRANPVQDVVSAVVHFFEWLDPHPTNHLHMYKRLLDSPAGPYLAYTLDEGTQREAA